MNELTDNVNIADNEEKTIDKKDIQRLKNRQAAKKCRYNKKEKEKREKEEILNRIHDLEKKCNKHKEDKHALEVRNKNLNEILTKLKLQFMEQRSYIARMRNNFQISGGLNNQIDSQTFVKEPYSFQTNVVGNGNNINDNTVNIDTMNTIFDVSYLWPESNISVDDILNVNDNESHLFTVNNLKVDGSGDVDGDTTDFLKNNDISLDDLLQQIQFQNSVTATETGLSLHIDPYVR